MIAVDDPASMPLSSIQILREFGVPTVVLLGVLWLIWKVIRASFPWVQALVQSHIEFVRALSSSQLEIRDRLAAIERAVGGSSWRRSDGGIGSEEGRTKARDPTG